MSLIVRGKRRIPVDDWGKRDGEGALRTRDHGGTMRNQWMSEIYRATSLDQAAAALRWSPWAGAGVRICPGLVLKPFF